jgi:DNA-binding NarL/FixJ family response regulator
MKNIVIAECHELFRSIFRELLTGFNIIGETNNGHIALKLVKKSKPDLLILDHSLIERAGMSIITQIKRSHSKIRILIVSLSDSIDDAHETIIAGADGYFLKYEGRHAFQSAISCVLDRIVFISPGLEWDFEKSKTATERKRIKPNAKTIRRPRMSA